MNAFAAESAAAAIRNLGKDLVTEGQAMYLAARRGPAAAAEIVKRVSSARKLIVSVERAVTELLMAVEPAAKTTEDANA